jgi:hypothetical protein
MRRKGGGPRSPIGRRCCFGWRMKAGVRSGLKPSGSTSRNAASACRQRSGGFGRSLTPRCCSRTARGADAGRGRAVAAPRQVRARPCPEPGSRARGALPLRDHEVRGVVQRPLASGIRATRGGARCLSRAAHGCRDDRDRSLGSARARGQEPASRSDSGPPRRSLRTAASGCGSPCRSALRHAGARPDLYACPPPGLIRSPPAPGSRRATRSAADAISRVRSCRPEGS